MKRQPSEWEKIIANKATDKELISKIYKQLMQLNSRKINNPIKKMGQRTKQTFLQRRHTDGQQTHEKMINFDHYQRNANQNHSEVPSHIVRMAAIKNLQTINSGEGAEKREPSCIVQFSSVAQSCPAICHPMNHSTPGLPVHHQLPEFTQTHVH